MRLGPMLGHGCEAARRPATHMGRHALAVLKQLDGLVRQPHVELLVDQRMGRAVEVFFHSHVIVDVNLGLGPGGQLKGHGR